MNRTAVLRRVAAWALPMVVLAVYTWHLGRTGLPDMVLYEAADSAGDMLQVGRGIESGWFVTGHHSDVGVYHPGPFALWVKALAGLLHQLGVGGSVYAVTMALFLGARILCLAVLGWAFARATSSRILGWSAVLGATLLLHREGRITGLDMQGSTIHFMSAWAVLLMLAGAVLVASGRGPVHLLVVGAGLTAHLHTPTFPLGVAGLLLVAMVMVRSFQYSRAIAAAWGLWLVFVIPLVTRVFLEPGFPLNYVQAARRRRELAGDPSGRTPLDGLAGVIDLPVPWLLALMALPALGAPFVWRRSRPAALVLAAASTWSALVITVSPPQERVATELVWIAGVLLFSAAIAVLAFAKIVMRTLEKVLSMVPLHHRRWLAPTTNVLGSALLLVGVLVSLSAALPTELSRSGGGDGRHVPAFADKIMGTEQPFVLVLADPNWFTTSSGVLLELERRGSEFCVAVNSAFSATLATFLTPERLCDRGKDHRSAFMVTWDAGKGLEELPAGASLVFELEGSEVAPEDPDGWICSQRPFGGVCAARLPGDARELLTSREPDEGAYGMVSSLRLVTFACTPDPDHACAEFAKTSR